MPHFHAHIQGDAGAGNPGDVLQGDQVGAVDAEEVGAEFFSKAEMLSFILYSCGRGGAGTVLWGIPEPCRMGGLPETCVISGPWRTEELPETHGVPGTWRMGELSDARGIFGPSCTGKPWDTL